MAAQFVVFAALALAERARREAEDQAQALEQQQLQVVVHAQRELDRMDDALLEDDWHPGTGHPRAGFRLPNFDTVPHSFFHRVAPGSPTDGHGGGQVDIPWPCAV